MKITIRSVHFDADEKLLDYVNVKVGKIEKFYDRIVGAEVFLRLDNQGKKIKDKIAEIRLLIPGNDLFAKAESKSFEESTLIAVESIQAQLKKHKEKLRK